MAGIHRPRWIAPHRGAEHAGPATPSGARTAHDVPGAGGYLPLPCEQLRCARAHGQWPQPGDEDGGRPARTSGRGTTPADGGLPAVSDAGVPGTGDDRRPSPGRKGRQSEPADQDAHGSVSRPGSGGLRLHGSHRRRDDLPAEPRQRSVTRSPSERAATQLHLHGHERCLHPLDVAGSGPRDGGDRRDDPLHSARR